ncbi:hypothetical protein ERJ75_000975300 [Trypanosoma vivax]|nr:hypothetical protein ERJ75_000975300 [Trypanosoma vivax]
MSHLVSAPTIDAIRSPERWHDAWKSLYERTIKKDQIVLSRDVKSPLNSSTFKGRLLLCVRTLPRLSAIKKALKRSTRSKRCRSSVIGLGDLGKGTQPSDDSSLEYQRPNPTIWAVENSVVVKVTVMDALSGETIMQITEPKRDLLVTSLMHAPFRGLINRQSEVIPIQTPRQLLRVRETALINTDYVWVGFSDGSIRLFPADPQRVQEWDRSAMLAKEELADLVFELPKYHKAAVIAITRSPCHEDDDITDVSVVNRLSHCIHALTAATASVSHDGREHLSLICTASEDSCIAVWDMQKIYRTMEEIRLLSCKKKTLELNDYGWWSTSFRGDAVTFLMNSSKKARCTVRSTCTMVKVRPLFKLKGDVGGLRTLNWITTVVTTENYKKERDIVAMTRDPKETSASKLIRHRRAVQNTTRWEKREEHRFMLRLSEREMREVEKELEQLMPPLATEPIQKRRINLIVAGDVHGSVHLWDLDEELECWQPCASASIASSPARSPSPISRASEDNATSFNFRATPSRRHERRSSALSSCVGTPYRSAERECLRLNRCAASVEPYTRIGVDPQFKRSTNGPSTATGCSSTRLVPKAKRHEKSKRATARSASPTSGKKMKTVSRRTATSATRERRPCSGRLSTIPSSVPSFSVSHSARQLTLVSPRSPCPGGGSNTPYAQRKLKRKPTPVSPRVGSSTREALKDPSGSSPAIRGRRRSTIMVENSLTLTSAKSKRRSTNHETARLKMASKSGVNDAEAMSGCRMRTLSNGSVRTGRRKHSARSGKCTGRSNGVENAEPEENEVSPRVSSARRRVTPIRRPSATLGEMSPSPSRRERTSIGCGAENRLPKEQYARKAKLSKRLIDGGTVTGIAADLPSTITITMRRLPDPPEPHYSLLEQPTEEEMRRRILANTFDTLTTECALFHAFQRLQFYVSVEGTVMNMKCIPNVVGEVKRPKSLSDNTLVDGYSNPVSGLKFNIVFQRHILEKHSQPIVLMFNDQARHHLYVARNDGMLSLISTETNTIVTRVPHPSANVALGPPKLTEWKREQVAMAMASGKPLHLEIHRECKKFPPGHFVNFTPISVQQQFQLLQVFRLYTDGHSSDVPSGSGMVERSFLVALDNRQRVDKNVRAREANLSKLLQTMRRCRENAISVRTAQRDNFNLLYGAASERLGRLVGQCATPNVLQVLWRAFRAWKLHNDLYPRKHILRGVRQRSIQQLARVAEAMSVSSVTVRIGEYFGKWLLAVCARRTRYGNGQLIRALGMGSCLAATAHQVAFLTNFNFLRGVWSLWRSAVSRSQEAESVGIVSNHKMSPIVASGSTLTFGPRAKRNSPHRSVSKPRGAARDTIFNDFYSIITAANSLRSMLIHFRFDEEADSVLDIDELWIDSIEAAASEVESNVAQHLKLAVFKMTLLPLLEGVVATAQELLPHSCDAPVSEEVRSMIRGCLLCLDYICADPEDLVDVEGLVGGDSITGRHSGKRHALTDVGEELQMEHEVRELFDLAMDDEDFQPQIEAISGKREVVERFFVQYNS